jgi:hypothetical protein
MEPEIPLPGSQEHATGPYPEPVKSNTSSPYFSKIRFNIILSSTPTSFKLSLPIKFSNQNFVFISVNRRAEHRDKKVVHLKDVKHFFV